MASDVFVGPGSNLVTLTVSDTATVQGSAFLLGTVGMGTSSPLSTHRLTLNTLAGSSNAWRVRNGDATRYRSDYQISATGVQTNAFDDTAGDYLPITIEGKPIRLGQTAGNNVVVGAGLATPTARLHIAAGSATANTAPLKFTSGTLLGTPEGGAIEFLTDDYYATITTGGARKGIVLNNGSALTSGKIPIASTNGRLIDGQTPLAGTKVYYVADSSGGAVTRKLTFIDGILTSET